MTSFVRLLILAFKLRLRDIEHDSVVVGGVAGATGRGAPIDTAAAAAGIVLLATAGILLLLATRRRRRLEPLIV